jgi:hypothetical protein
MILLLVLALTSFWPAPFCRPQGACSASSNGEIPDALIESRQYLCVGALGNFTGPVEAPSIQSMSESKE